MGNRGRFGKYGDIKRVAKLRAARMHPLAPKGPKRPQVGEPALQKGEWGKGTGILVRPGRKEDAGFVRALSERAFKLYGDYGDVIAQWLESGVAETLMAVRHGRPMGFAMIGKSAELGTQCNRLELLAIAVQERERRKGLGSRLLREIIRLAKNRGADELMLHTGSDNTAAIRLFQKNGFEVVGLRKAFYPRGQDALVMRKIL